MPTITVQIPDGEEAVYEFDEDYITIGRTETNHIIIDHGSLSGTHAQMVKNEDGTYTIGDNGSTNGTFVNGEQIAEAVVPHNAEILFGQVSATYYQPEIAGMLEVLDPADPALGSGFAEPLDSSGRPANFGSVSPFPKNRKVADPIKQAVTILGVLSLLTAIGVVGAVFMSLQ